MLAEYKSLRRDKPGALMRVTGLLALHAVTNIESLTVTVARTADPPAFRA